MTTKNSLVTTGKTGDSMETRHPGKDESVHQAVPLVRENPNQNRTVLEKLPPEGPQREGV